MERDEKQLIALAKAGDERSFEQLIEGCKTRAYNIALRYMRNEEDAMDALQESFIKIFRYLKQFKEDSRFDTWVYRIVVNTCNDMLRKNSNAKNTESIHRGGEDEEHTMEIPDSAPQPWEQMERKEQAQFLIRCMELLGEDQKEVIILRDIQGFSYEEVASMLDCSMGTVKSRINRARKKLKDIILEQKQRNCV